MRSRILPLAAGVAAWALVLPAAALDCGGFEFPACEGPEAQYAGGFDPGVGYGGFGGGACTAERTPVVFVHGNGDRAIGWDAPAATAPEGFPPPVASVYDTLRAGGYTDCELFGVTYLSEEERESPALNYHRPEKYRIIAGFIEAVLEYTGAAKVDLVAHSLGSSMSLAALTYAEQWDRVRRFVNIAGGLRGLSSCLYVGFANPLVTTCGSENLLDHFVFGFYPSGLIVGRNRWTASAGPYSLRRMPEHHPEVLFYTLHAGEHDQIHCTSLRGREDCSEGALFVDAPNVRAQLDLGAGAAAGEIDLDFSDLSPYVRSGGDSGGVGHFKARNNAGEIILAMLRGDCDGLACAAQYDAGPVAAE